jgi:NADH-quinone oxidoreductase subunit K
VTPGLTHYLFVGAVLFALGVYTAVTRQSAIGVLLGIELMLNAANLNFVAFQYFRGPGHFEGQIFALSVIVIAAAEAVIALAIVLALYSTQKSIDVSEADTLRD